jgi:cytochrome P450
MSGIDQPDDLYWDPYDYRLHADPHPVWRRMREEAPLYRNEQYDFWAVTRFDDVSQVLVDWRTYSSAEGDILEVIRNPVNEYTDSLIQEDPPLHDIHRHMLSRVFTPRAVRRIEERVRSYARVLLDELHGAVTFDFIEAYGARIPALVIAAMLGTPDEDVDEIRHLTDAQLDVAEGEPLDRATFDEYSARLGEYFMGHVVARRKDPTDDIMSTLVTLDFTARRARPATSATSRRASTSPSCRPRATTRRRASRGGRPPRSPSSPSSGPSSSSGPT